MLDITDVDIISEGIILNTEGVERFLELVMLQKRYQNVSSVTRTKYLFIKWSPLYWVIVSLL